MLETLFSSRVRVRLLTIFLLNTDSHLHASALVQKVGAHYNAVWKELAHLEKIGLLKSEIAANTKSYFLNTRFPILPELRAIILKTVGIGDTIRQALASLNVNAAFVYGSFASGDMDRQSDVDIMIIGEVELEQLAPIVVRLEKNLGRLVNYIVYSSEEWQEKVDAKEPFIANVLASPKIMLIGEEDALRATRPTRTHQTVQGAPGRNTKIAKSRRTRSHRG